MSESVTWAAVGMAAVSNMGLWLKIVMDKKKANGKSNNLLPGKADICIKRGEKLVELETRQDSYEEDVKEIKSDIKAIKGAVVQK